MKWTSSGDEEFCQCLYFKFRNPPKLNAFIVIACVLNSVCSAFLGITTSINYLWLCVNFGHLEMLVSKNEVASFYLIQHPIDPTLFIAFVTVIIGSSRSFLNYYFWFAASEVTHRFVNCFSTFSPSKHDWLWLLQKASQIKRSCIHNFVDS